ncbi:hypothetical protein DKX38_022297 [Salix brachista]|uniref:Uncharacterized protein n=1 Tax=Salix brachista TaxID=2182728 RepID=A0A5N5JZD0_9ROSI|nr:hypothetical protein DKX38_022297 [Salix brachista]
MYNSIYKSLPALTTSLTPKAAAEVTRLLPPPPLKPGGSFFLSDTWHAISYPRVSQCLRRRKSPPPPFLECVDADGAFFPNLCILLERDPFLCQSSSAGGNPSLHTGAFPAEDAAGEHDGATTESYSFQHSTICCSSGPGPAGSHRLLQCSEGAGQ